MLREQARVGMKVIFGRQSGEKSLGEILKCNPSRAKVKLLEDRGRGRGSAPGSTWIVPYSLMQPATDAESVMEGRLGGVFQAVHTPLDEPQPLEYTPFQSQAECLIIQAIACTYGELSPENLTCDGELAPSQVRIKEAGLRRRLQGLFRALGREVNESQVYAWERQYREARLRSNTR